jgi:hypothetical protein
VCANLLSCSSDKFVWCCQDGRTALHVAVEKYSRSDTDGIVKMLVDAGANVLAKDEVCAFDFKLLAPSVWVS